MNMIFLHFQEGTKSLQSIGQLVGLMLRPSPTFKGDKINNLFVIK